jgi:nitrogen fixation-related uncharacterized protein
VIEFFRDVYAVLASGIVISMIVAALFYWYAIHIDSKQYDDFDKKYRESRKDNK